MKFEQIRQEFFQFRLICNLFQSENKWKGRQMGSFVNKIQKWKIEKQVNQIKARMLNERFKINHSICFPALVIVIFRLYKAYKFFIPKQLMNQQFELKLLLKQNSEMVSRIQSYRRENQLLIQKNEDLNLWVQNLSQVFASIGAAWKTITNNQQGLFNLMKKRSDPNSKTLISKYISHFRTFDQIIDRLGEKITNSGHSNEVTLEVKTRLAAFVQNYEMFFKEIVDSYFRFNDQYLQWITELKNKPELSQNFRLIANKQIENKLKIKQFEQFMAEYRNRFKEYEVQNQHKLMDGLLWKKNEQINSLKQLNLKQTRRLQLISTYLTANSQRIIESDDGADYECFCGGRQLEYFKKEWEKHLEDLRNISAKNTHEQKPQQSNTENGEMSSSTVKHSKQDMELIEFEKQKLFERISTLNQKIEKMRLQSRLSEEMVLNSSAYSILHSQAEGLASLVIDLTNKINSHYTLLNEIQKAREQEIIELKKKLQTQIKQDMEKSYSQKIPGKSSPQYDSSSSSKQNKVQTSLVQFKTTLTQSIKQLLKQCAEINSKIDTKQETLSQSKQIIQKQQQQIQQLNKKIQNLQSQKHTYLQFRHEKFNQVDKKITELIANQKQIEPSEKQHISKLWQEFIGYVKSRDKKVKDLENSIKKKQKQISTKDKLVSYLQENLKETQTVFITTQAQNKKINQFIAHTEKQLLQLAQKNLTLRTEYEQQKLLNSYKTKTQNEAKIKMEEKLKSYEALQQQIKQVQRITHETETNYENWITEQQKRLMQVSVQLQQTKTNYLLKKTEYEEKDKSIKKLNQEKQKWKSQCNKLGARINAFQSNSQLGMLKMEMEEYKRKIMCNCSRDQQRTVVLKTCSHTFCKRCVQDLKNVRNRKCPLCGTKFDKNDLHEIILS